MSQDYQFVEGRLRLHGAFLAEQLHLVDDESVVKLRRDGDHGVLFLPADRIQAVSSQIVKGTGCHERVLCSKMCIVVCHYTVDVLGYQSVSVSSDCLCL